MVDMTSNLMLVDEHLLWLAQREDKACSGIVGALERIGGAALSPHAQHISVVTWVSWEGAAGSGACWHREGLEHHPGEKYSLSGSSPPSVRLAGKNADSVRLPGVQNQILSCQGQCRKRQASGTGEAMHDITVRAQAVGDSAVMKSGVMETSGPWAEGDISSGGQ